MLKKGLLIIIFFAIIGLVLPAFGDEAEIECKKAVENDESLTYAEKVIAKRDCEAQSRESQSSEQDSGEDLGLEKIGKKWVTDCEEFIERYIMIGEQNFYDYYGTSFFLRSCVKIYTIGLWDYQGDEKFKKIGIMFEGGELAELESGRAVREKNRIEAIIEQSTFASDIIMQQEVEDLKERMSFLEQQLTVKDEQLAQKDALLMEQLKVISDLANMIKNAIWEPILNHFSMA